MRLINDYLVHSSANAINQMVQVQQDVPAPSFKYLLGCVRLLVSQVLVCRGFEGEASCIATKLIVNSVLQYTF